MMKTIIKFLIIILLGYAIGMTVYQKKTMDRNLIFKVRLEDLNEINAKAKTELSRLDSERVRLEDDAERMKADSLTYLKQQKVLQDELGKLKNKIASNENKIGRLSKELALAKQEVLQSQQEQQKLGYKKETELKSKQEEISLLNSELDRLKQVSGEKQALFHYNLGVIYTEAGRYDEAVSEYEKALKLNPSLSQVYYNLGIIHSDYFKDTQKAVYYYQQYLRLDPNASDAEEVQSWIDQLR